MKNPIKYFSVIQGNVVIYIVAVALMAGFLVLHYTTRISFFLNLAAVPVQVLVVIFIINKLLRSREKSEKRRQLAYIKSCLFRSDMLNLFTSNLNALKSPAVSVAQIKNSSLSNLKRMRKAADEVEYTSLQAMEPVIMEYANTQSVWNNFMDLAISYGFENILKDMIYILHFINDIRRYKARYPDRLFIEYAAKKPELMQKVYTVLGDGVRKFLEFMIEMKEKHPAMFNDIISVYEAADEASDDV